jgi:hypothetical protein
LIQTQFNIIFRKGALRRNSHSEAIENKAETGGIDPTAMLTPGSIPQCSPATDSDCIGMERIEKPFFSVIAAPTFLGSSALARKDPTLLTKPDPAARLRRG